MGRRNDDCGVMTSIYDGMKGVKIGKRCFILEAFCKVMAQG